VLRAAAQVLQEAQAQAAGGLMIGGLSVSHMAHLGGALAGVLLVLLLRAIPDGEE
jgi:membrane associated rhomboid family serine protease